MAMWSESNSEIEARFSFISIIQAYLLLPRAESFAYSSIKILLDEYSRYVSMCVIYVCVCAVHISLIFSMLTCPPLPLGWRKTQDSQKELNCVGWKWLNKCKKMSEEYSINCWISLLFISSSMLSMYGVFSWNQGT